jgi:hypothetical protein
VDVASRIWFLKDAGTAYLRRICGYGASMGLMRFLILVVLQLTLMSVQSSSGSPLLWSERGVVEIRNS